MHVVFGVEQVHVPHARVSTIEAPVACAAEKPAGHGNDPVRAMHCANGAATEGPHPLPSAAHAPAAPMAQMRPIVPADGRDVLTCPVHVPPLGGGAVTAWYADKVPNENAVHAPPPASRTCALALPQLEADECVSMMFPCSQEGCVPMSHVHVHVAGPSDGSTTTSEAPG